MSDIIIEVEKEEAEQDETTATDIIDSALEIVEKIEDAKQASKWDDEALNSRLNSIDDQLSNVLSKLNDIETLVTIAPVVTADIVEDVIEDVIEEVETVADVVEEIDETVSDFEEIPEEIEAPIVRTKKTRRWL